MNHPLQLIGRSSSHFTRVPRIVAHELGQTLELVPIHDLTRVDADAYAGNPARKIPSLRTHGSLVFGAENICRALADLAGEKRRIVWPEELHTNLMRNAQELVWHAMAAQVQLVFGTLVAQLPADNLYFVKGRQGYEGALSWLEEHLAESLAALPAPRCVSLFEVTLFCLMDHIAFRQTLPTQPYPGLLHFAAEFAKRPSAQSTAYAFDPAPAS
jgi:glutathione S-transferase